MTATVKTTTTVFRITFFNILKKNKKKNTQFNSKRLTPPTGH